MHNVLDMTSQAHSQSKIKWSWRKKGQELIRLIQPGIHNSYTYRGSIKNPLYEWKVRILTYFGHQISHSMQLYPNKKLNFKETLGTTTTTNPHSSDEVLRFKLITKSTHMKTPCADKKIWPTWSVSRFKFRCYLAANDKVQMWNIQSAGDH